MHINYKLLRAMFLDAKGNTKNIELFKVFVKHELTHMEFATSNNPLYKAAHNIPFLEEFLVSFSDLYVWQQVQLILLPEYTNVKFIFTNA
jgi:5-bromo-4-chloroindolyl phosphate hydrolysis protein